MGVLKFLKSAGVPDLGTRDDLAVGDLASIRRRPINGEI